MTSSGQPSGPGGAGEIDGACRALADFALPSAPGHERTAMERVAAAVGPLGLPPARLERLKTAVAEATMNAMEHGNRYRAEAPVTVRVLASDDALRVRITDRGSGPIPAPATDAPDLEARLEGRQPVRGWGLFLIRSMVDEMSVTADGAHHTVELVMHLKGDGNAGETA